MKTAKASKILLNISAVFCFIYFALYIFTLVFIPIGVYCFLAGKRFAYKAEHLEDTIFVTNKELKFYSIFASIFCFPFGLLSLIPYYFICSNRIKVSDLNYVNTRVEDLTKQEKEENVIKEDVSQPSEEVHQETESEKLEKYKKLENFKEKGLITEEELNQAYEQLFGKKEDK